MTCSRFLSALPFVVSLVSAIPALAQVASVSAVTLSANASQVNGAFIYQYKLVSSSSNTGSVSSIEIDISLPHGGATLSGSGLGTGPGFLSSNSSAITSEPTTTAMVPVGADSPVGWVATVTSEGDILFAADTQTALVPPGQSLSNLQITSYGLPGIRQFRVEPYVDFDSLPLAQPTPETLPTYFTALKSLLAGASYTGWTLAPTAPPANFIPLDFLTTIQNYKEQSVALGWISDNGIANSLDAKLNAAYASLNAGDAQTAKNVLGAFINELNAQNGKNVATEAYGLLRFNAEYLIGKL